MRVVDTLLLLTVFNNMQHFRICEFFIHFCGMVYVYTWHSILMMDWRLYGAIVFQLCCNNCNEQGTRARKNIT